MNTADPAILTRPKLLAPAGTADCHIHIYGAADKYPVAPTSPFAPPHAPVANYRKVMQRLGIEHAVIVQPAGYGADNRCTLDALDEFGGVARAVVTVTPETPRSEIARMNALGVSGARCLLLPGAILTWDKVPAVARLVADFGWHVQLQFDGRILPDRIDAIRSLPCPAVIDHNAKFLEPVSPDHPAFSALKALLDTGRIWVKASAPYETSRAGPPLYGDVGVLARALIAHRPDRIVWATNWPHGGEKVKPDDAMLLDILLDWAPDEALRKRILVDNPKALYGF